MTTSNVGFNLQEGLQVRPARDDCRSDLEIGKEVGDIAEPWIMYGRAGGMDFQRLSAEIAKFFTDFP